MSAQEYFNASYKTTETTLHRFVRYMLLQHLYKQ